MSSLMFYCLKVLISTIFEKRVTDRRTDGPMDGQKKTLMEMRGRI